MQKNISVKDAEDFSLHRYNILKQDVMFIYFANEIITAKSNILSL